MPELPLLDEGGKPIRGSDAYFIVQGIMWWPKDKASASSYFTLTAGGLTEMFKKTYLKHSKRKVGGTITASVFLHLLQFKIHRPKDASVGKAVFVVSRLLEKKPSSGTKSVPADRDYVHK